MKNGWTWLMVGLFILSMLAYPSYSGFLFGWPVSFLVSVGLFLIYLIVLPLFIKTTLDRQD